MKKKAKKLESGYTKLKQRCKSMELSIQSMTVVVANLRAEAGEFRIEAAAWKDAHNRLVDKLAAQLATRYPEVIGPSGGEAYEAAMPGRAV